MMGNEAAALVSAALAARKNAYVPYSGYPVGAAVLGEDGNIFTGCNVENVSYPAGMCAERNAIGSAVTAGIQVFRESLWRGVIRVLRCPAESAARS